MVKLNENQRFIALVVAVVLLFAGVFASVAMDIAQTQAINNLQTEVFEGNEAIGSLKAEEFVTETEATAMSRVKIHASAPRLMANPDAGVATVAETYVAQELTATIFPNTASNILVDWTIAWESSSQTADIAQYITVNPTYAGSRVCEVRCFKALPGNAVITVTTRDGGHTAKCTVKFVGIPTTMTVTNSTLDRDMSGNYKVPMFSRTTYNFDINLGNIFNSVGTTYKNYSVVSVTPFGNIMAGSQCDYGDGTIDWSSVVKTPLTTYKDDFTATISGSTLKVNIPNVSGLYTNYSETSSETMYDDYFYSAIEGEVCGVTVVVKNTSGLTATVKIVFDSDAVVSVSLDESSLTF